MTIHKHEPMSYGFMVKALDDPVEWLEQFNIPRTPIIFRGYETLEKVTKYFVKKIIDVSRKIEDLLETNKLMNMSDEEHVVKNECDLCKTWFSVKNHKVAEHYHLNGKFRQTSCNNCNIKLHIPNFGPCVLHNLSNYDAHNYDLSLATI